MDQKMYLWPYSEIEGTILDPIKEKEYSLIWDEVPCTLARESKYKAKIDNWADQLLGAERSSHGVRSREERGGRS